MKMYFSVRLFKAFFPAFFTIILASCEKEQVSVHPSAGDYYPSTVGSSWNYQSTWTSQWDTTSFIRTEQALSDTIYDGKPYTYFGLQLIRKENGNYYRRTNFYGIGEEYIFLKDNLPAGGTWTHSSYPEHKAEFVIEAIHREKTVNGKVYKDVIEVEKRDYHKYDSQSDFTLIKTITSLYAKNVGEIYSLEKHPDSSAYENEITSYSLK